MSEDGGVNGKEVWSTPYVRPGGVHSLSGSALAEVAREVLSAGHSFRFLALGGSMSPFIRDGDVVTLVTFVRAVCAPGDVVAFVQHKSGRLVVHRVVAVGEGRCRIRGDNSSEEDGEFPFESVIGTVDRIERAGKEIRFGLGPERATIALLSRRGWLCWGMKRVGTVNSLIRRHS